MTDNRFPGFSLLVQSSATTTVQTPLDISFPFPITSLVPPIVAVQVQTFNWTWLRMCKILGSPGNWTGFRLVSARATSSYPAQTTWKYRVYAAGVTSSESYGIRVQDDFGSTLFDSGLRQLVFANLFTSWADWPRTTSQRFQAGREHTLIETFVSPLLSAPSDAWIALSLANASMLTINTVAGSGAVKYENLYSELTYVWQDSRIVVLADHLCIDYAPLTFSIPTNIFCPVILN